MLEYRHNPPSSDECDDEEDDDYNRLYLAAPTSDDVNPALGIALTPFDIDIISSKTALTGGFYHRGVGKK